MYRLISSLVFLAALRLQAQSPVEFGRHEFLAALEARAIDPGRFKVVTEHSMVLPQDGFSIMGNLIRGGNLRGIMYGLLEAASQIRKSGRLYSVKASPAMPVRGIRWTQPLPDDLPALFETLARDRFNRFVIAQPECSPEELRKVAEVAARHGVDIGIALPASTSPAAYVSATPLLKFVESAPVESHLKEITGAGRLLTLDLDAETLDEPMLQAALDSQIPVQVIAAPGRTGFFLRQPEVADRTRPWQVIWRLRTHYPTDAASIRAMLPALTRDATQGFELEISSTPAPELLELWGRLAFNPDEPATPTKPANPKPATASAKPAALRPKAAPGK